MKKKQAVIGSVIIALVILNSQQWWPQDDNEMKTVSSASGNTNITPEALQLSIVLGSSKKKEGVQRNIFTEKKRPIKKVVLKKPKPKPVVKLPPSPSAEELLVRSIKLQLAQYKLMGIIFRGGRPQAFLINSSKTYTVYIGDLIDGKYKIKNITERDLVLIEENTNISRRITLGDEE